MNAQDRSQDSTPTVTGKSRTDAPVAKVGDMPLKSPVASRQVLKPKRLDESSDDKAVPIRAVYFDKLLKWPGIAGAATCLSVGKPGTMMSQNVMYCDSIFLYKGDFVINGQYFMPKTCGSILTYEF